MGLFFHRRTQRPSPAYRPLPPPLLSPPGSPPSSLPHPTYRSLRSFIRSFNLLHHLIPFIPTSVHSPARIIRFNSIPSLYQPPTAIIHIRSQHRNAARHATQEKALRLWPCHQRHTRQEVQGRNRRREEKEDTPRMVSQAAPAREGDARQGERD